MLSTSNIIEVLYVPNLERISREHNLNNITSIFNRRNINDKLEIQSKNITNFGKKNIEENLKIGKLQISFYNYQSIIIVDLRLTSGRKRASTRSHRPAKYWNKSEGSFSNIKGVRGRGDKSPKEDCRICLRRKRLRSIYRFSDSQVFAFFFSLFLLSFNVFSIANLILSSFDSRNLYSFFFY